ncbi:hypothetical protein D3C73_708000 [compost metagenome]
MTAATPCAAAPAVSTEPPAICTVPASPARTPNAASPEVATFVLVRVMLLSASRADTPKAFAPCVATVASVAAIAPPAIACRPAALMFVVLTEVPDRVMLLSSSVARTASAPPIAAVSAPLVVIEPPTIEAEAPWLTLTPTAPSPCVVMRAFCACSRLPAPSTSAPWASRPMSALGN